MAGSLCQGVGVARQINWRNKQFADEPARRLAEERDQRAVQRNGHIRTWCAAPSAPRLGVKPNWRRNRQARHASGARANHQIDSCLRWHGRHDRIGRAAKGFDDECHVFNPRAKVRCLTHIGYAEASCICQ